MATYGGQFTLTKDLHAEREKRPVTQGVVYDADHRDGHVQTDR